MDTVPPQQKIPETRAQWTLGVPLDAISSLSEVEGKELLANTMSVPHIALIMIAALVSLPGIFKDAS